MVRMHLISRVPELAHRYQVHLYLPAKEFCRIREAQKQRNRSIRIVGFRERVHEASDTSVPRLIRIISGACAPGGYVDDTPNDYDTRCLCTRRLSRQCSLCYGRVASYVHILKIYCSLYHKNIVLSTGNVAGFLF